MYDVPLGREDFAPPFRFDATPMPAPPKPARRASINKTSNGEKKPITRNRTSYSCHVCRRRKIKCDKIHPVCSGCAKTGDRCVYNENSRDGSTPYPESSPEEIRHTAKRRKPESTSKDSSAEESSPEFSGETPNTSRHGSIETRLDRLTSLVEALSKGKASDSPESAFTELGLRPEKRAPARPPNGGYRNVDYCGSDPLHPIPSRDGRQPQTPTSRGHSAEQSTSPEPDLPPGEASELADPMSKMNIGYLSVQEGGRTRYVGSTFWAYVSDEIDQLNSLLRTSNRYAADSCHDDSLINDAEQQLSPSSEISDDSQHHNSFHRSGNHRHTQNAQFRDDCPACTATAHDKSILLHSLESHPSRFRRLDSDVAQGVPSAQQSHVLFRCWLSGVHGQIPLLYPPLVLRKYTEFWSWYENDRQHGKPVPEPAMMPVFYAIWYAGSVSISLKGLRAFFPNMTRAKLSSNFHDHITRSLRQNSFPRIASIPSLAAFIMVNMILAKEEEPITSSLYVSLALRVAQNLGLHREPTLFGLPAWEVETRRRIWWQIIQNDSFIAIASGLPPLVNDDFFDTKFVSEVKDSKLGTTEAEEYERAVAEGTRPRDNPDNPLSRNRNSMVCVHYVVARGKCIMTRGVRRMLKIHVGTKPLTKGDMAEIRHILNEVEHGLNECIGRIPTKGIPEMGFTPDRDEKGRSLVADLDPDLAQLPSEADLRPFDGPNASSVQYHWNTLVAYHKWARIMLSLTIDKIYCVSYAPFLKNAKSKLWPAARQCALRRCHGYMRKFNSLATDPAFQPFQWSWPGMHQPMHAAMIMLVDLYERPNSIEAPRSRAFIDKIFSMSGPDGGIVSGEDGVTVQRPLREGGREAWEMLRRLREKAWQKAGLDPDVLWTEEDQIQAGVAAPLTEGQKIAQSLREDAFMKAEQSGNSGEFVIDEMLRAAQASEAEVDPGHTTSGGPPGSEAFRPKALRRLPTTQQPTPFRSTTFRAPNPTSTETANHNKSSQMAHDSKAPYISNGDSAGDRFADSVPVDRSGPVPAMPVPNQLYFNPPTAASSNNAESGGNSTNWSAPTPDGLGEGLMPHVSADQTLTTAPQAAGALHHSAGVGILRLDIHDAPSPPPVAGPTQSRGLQEQPLQLLPHTDTETGHFDWEKWDAVFGQHVGLEDMMMVDEEGDWESGKHGHGRGGPSDDMAD